MALDPQLRKKTHKVWNQVFWPHIPVLFSTDDSLFSALMSVLFFFYFKKNLYSKYTMLSQFHVYSKMIQVSYIYIIIHIYTYIIYIYYTHTHIYTYIIYIHHTYIYAHIFFFRFFSIIAYYEILNIVLYALQQVFACLFCIQQCVYVNPQLLVYLFPTDTAQ